MKYGINLPISTSAATPAIVSAAARRAEELGFSSLWVGDHVALPLAYESRYPYASDGRMNWDLHTPWLDPLMTLLWAAAATRHIRVGTAVLIPAMRPPVLLAKQLATLDQLSGGRLTVGAGMGWLGEEFALMGAGFDKRGARMTEAIQVLQACWRDRDVAYRGDYHQLAPFACEPKPAQGAALPILIGGTGDLMLKRVATLGCGWLPIELPLDEFAARRNFLAKELEAAGRSLDDVQVVMQSDVASFTPDAAKAYAALGVGEVIVEINWRKQSIGAAMDQMSEVAQRFGLRGQVTL
jgi:probable F420-dependent oxidoreductase